MLRAISLLLFATIGCGLTASNLFAGDAVLIEFTSQRCKFCEMMHPVIAQLESEQIAVRSVDVDRETDMAVRFGIDQLPTYVIYTGGKEASRLVGMQPIETIREALRESQRPPRLKDTEHSSPVPMTEMQPVRPASPPTVRSEPMPSESLAAAVARAEGASVRLRAFENTGHNVGSGTIIDSRGDEMLVLTCGHLFRESNGEARIEVDLFHGGQTHTVPGQLVDFNAQDRDIALVSIRTSLPIEPVAVIPDQEQPRNGDSVFSFGCDRGADPTRRDTRITGINKYNQHLKLSNLEIAGAPIDGRSGGGLFDAHGRLIGVCNSADHNGNIGIYAGPGEVYWQLKRIAMEHLYTSPGQAADSLAGATDRSRSRQTAVPDSLATATDRSPSRQTSVPASLAAASDRSRSRQTSDPASLAAAADRSRSRQTSDPASPAIASDADQEVIVIVRNRNQPTQDARVLTFDTPPAAILEMLRR